MTGWLVGKADCPLPWHELSLGGLGPLKIKKIDVNIKRTPKKHGQLDVTHLYIYTLVYLLNSTYNVFSKDNILRENMFTVINYFFRNVFNLIRV